MQTAVKKPNKQCGSKHRLDSEYDALAWMKEVVGNNPDFNVYLCPHCQFWHIGHKPSASAA